MTRPTKLQVRVVVLLGIFLLSFAAYGAAEAGSDPLAYTVMALMVILMIAGILAG